MRALKKSLPENMENQRPMKCLKVSPQALDCRVVNKIIENKSLYIINQFNMLKKFIVSNSIPFEDVRLQKIGTMQSKNYGNFTINE